ncbi:MAG: cation transporter [Bacteroidota bacterium]|nr:cation transporter [Bacteroidota bacterium]
MKNYTNQFRIIISFFAIAFFITACSTENTADSDEITELIVEGEENKALALIEVEGMSCEIGCARYIKGKIAKLNGVYESEVLFEEKTARISYDPTIISGKQLVSQINSLNDGQYKVGKVSIEKTVKKQISLEENTSGKKINDKKIDEVSYVPPFKSIAFPNIFNVFKIKII